MNLAELMLELTTTLDRPDLTDAQVINFLTAGVRDLERKHNWRHMKVYIDHALSEDDHTFDNPIPNYKELISARIKDSNGYRYLPLTRMSREEALTYYPDLTNDTGKPLIIAEISELETESGLAADALPTQQFMVRPTCDDSYTLEINAYQYSSVAKNWWYSNEWEMAMYAALIRAEKYLKNDKRVNLWKDDLREMIEELKDAQEREKISGSYPRIKMYPSIKPFNINSC